MKSSDFIKLQWSDIEWSKHELMPSQQARLKIGQYSLSIISEVTDSSLYECAVFVRGRFVQIKGIHPEGAEWQDDVLRYLTQEEVLGIVRKLESITKTHAHNAKTL